MTMFDLSHPIYPGMPIYPGDPQVEFDSALSIPTDGAEVTGLHFGTHTGTHLDAPSHSIPNGQTVDQLDLALLHGSATVLQLRHEAAAQQPIGRDNLAQIPNQLPNIVCIATGWDQYFHTPRRERHPYIEVGLAELLWQRGARVLGVDTLSPDPTAEAADTFPVHQFWLGSGGIIVENLRNLTKLPLQVQMSMLPLPLQGLDGSPIRAIAWAP